MKAANLAMALVAAGTLAVAGGCFVPKTQLSASETQNRVLAEQSRAQLAEIENLKAHSRNKEDQLNRAEQELAALQEQATLDHKRLSNSQREASELHEQFKGAIHGQRLPATVSRQLGELSQRYPGLHFDPAAGTGQLDTDSLFDTASADMKPAARSMLGDLAHILQSPEAGELKVMVVGHADNQWMAGSSARDLYPNSFRLSMARASAVADLLRRQGLAERRIGVAGFGTRQPTTSNATASNQPKECCVDIFVMAPNVPVVGWTEAAPGVH